MKQYTNEQILEEFQRIWDTEHKELYCMGWESEGCIEVLLNEPEHVQVKLACMYEPPAFNIQVIMKVAEFFGTTNINDADKFEWGGCETCDYGSQYGFTLDIQPEKV